MNTTNESLELRLEELRTLRSEIRVELHLATRDLRDDWDRLEKQIPDAAVFDPQLQRASPGEVPRNEPSIEACEALAHHLRHLRESLWRRKQADATPVASLMARTVVACRGSATLDEAARQMSDEGVRCLVVVDDDGRVAGVLTDRDCLMSAHTQNRGLDAIQVQTAVSGAVHSCRPEDSLAAVEDVMRARQIDCMPVLDADGRPQGVISLDDLARATEQRPAGEGVVPPSAATAHPPSSRRARA